MRSVRCAGLGFAAALIWLLLAPAGANAINAVGLTIPVQSTGGSYPAGGVLGPEPGADVNTAIAYLDSQGVVMKKAIYNFGGNDFIRDGVPKPEVGFFGAFGATDPAGNPQSIGVALFNFNLDVVCHRRLQEAALAQRIFMSSDSNVHVTGWNPITDEVILASYDPNCNPLGVSRQPVGPTDTVFSSARDPVTGHIYFFLRNAILKLGPNFQFETGFGTGGRTTFTGDVISGAPNPTNNFVHVLADSTVDATLRGDTLATVNTAGTPSMFRSVNTGPEGLHNLRWADGNTFGVGGGTPPMSTGDHAVFAGVNPANNGPLMGFGDPTNGLSFYKTGDQDVGRNLARGPSQTIYGVGSSFDFNANNGRMLAWKALQSSGALDSAWGDSGLRTIDFAGVPVTTLPDGGGGVAPSPTTQTPSGPFVLDPFVTSRLSQFVSTRNITIGPTGVRTNATCPPSSFPSSYPAGRAKVCDISAAIDAVSRDIANPSRTSLAAQRGRRVVLARGRFVLRAGQRRRVRIPLTRRGKQVVRRLRRKRLRARLDVTVRRGSRTASGADRKRFRRNVRLRVVKRRAGR